MRNDRQKFHSAQPRERLEQSTSSGSWTTKTARTQLQVGHPEKRSLAMERHFHVELRDSGGVVGKHVDGRAILEVHVTIVVRDRARDHRSVDTSVRLEHTGIHFTERQLRSGKAAGRRNHASLHLRDLGDGQRLRADKERRDGRQGSERVCPSDHDCSYIVGVQLAKCTVGWETQRSMRAVRSLLLCCLVWASSLRDRDCNLWCHRTYIMTTLFATSSSSCGAVSFQDGGLEPTVASVIVTQTMHLFCV
ncbi:hypothetical protein L1887_57038 [Cichorium endivia]|nr:hypothetical protein L1887_57038 [Cichorium endivia]